MAEAAEQLSPAIQFTGLSKADIPDVLALGERFFNESEYPPLTQYNPECWGQVLAFYVETPAIHPCVLARIHGELVGMVMFQIATTYTKDPMALLSLAYVAPEHRRGPLGRILFQAAEDIARDAGCFAFYSGTMANMPGQERQEKMMCNMHRKMGFDPLPGWFRKVLK